MAGVLRSHRGFDRLGGGLALGDQLFGGLSQELAANSIAHRPFAL